MKPPVVVVGMGQLGTVFAEGFLKLGHPVIPVRRGERIDRSLQAEADGPSAPKPTMVVVAVGEDDLQTALESVPLELRDRVVLLQNELRPGQWRDAGIQAPTVAIVWFEKKAGKAIKEVRPTVIAGHQAELIAAALKQMGVTCQVKAASVGDAEVAHELVLKNLYILGLNLTGLAVGGTAGGLLAEHKKEFEKVIDDIFNLESGLLDSDDTMLSRDHLDRVRLIRELEAAINSDPEHGASGRSAPRRLERSLAHGRKVGVQLEHLEALAKKVLS